MKKYIKPSFECVELRAEERLAHCILEGSCPPNMIVNLAIS